VVVKFESADGYWRLTIDDDGRGFHFPGRFSLAELEAQRRGPVVIKECARALDAELIIDSQPGHGLRLEVILPHKAGAAHA
jgi:signal transduction histidine kinase